jgi:hypothetical protein
LVNGQERRSMSGVEQIQIVMPKIALSFASIVG